MAEPGRFIVCGCQATIPGSAAAACSECRREVFISPSGRRLRDEQGLTVICLGCAPANGRVAAPTADQEAELVAALGPETAALATSGVHQLGDPRGSGAGKWTLLPPPPGVCSQCARDHEPGEPHDRESLHYQYAFYAEHGRWPTWRDAMAHCDDQIRGAWTDALRDRGVDIG